ncbi:MAG: 50S ribosomal protein L19 [Parcubacteria group bacterium]|jgi:large subunit ribosomal protein L19
MEKKKATTSEAEKLVKFNEKVRKSAKRPDLRAGDIVKIHRKIKEGNKERVQVFEGIVVSIKGKQSSSPMVTVRKISFGVGIEITVPLYSPVISKIEAVKRAQTRQSKLYYLRKRDFRLSKLKMKELDKFVAKEEEIPVEEEVSLDSNISDTEKKNNPLPEEGKKEEDSGKHEE